MTWAAIDHHGSVVYLHGKHPRKALLEALGRKRASKVYQDKSDGRAVHVGYIVAGRWFTLFQKMEVPA